MDFPASLHHFVTFKRRISNINLLDFIILIQDYIFKNIKQRVVIKASEVHVQRVIRIIDEKQIFLILASLIKNSVIAKIRTCTHNNSSIYSK